MLARHAGTTLEPNLSVISDFKEYLDREKTHIMPILDDYISMNPYTFADYIADKPISVKKQLEQGWEYMMTKNKISFEMKCFCKIGETFQAAKQSVLDGSNSFRPRNIFSPHPSLKAGPGWVNKYMMKTIKKACPSFVSAMNNEELALYMNKYLQPLIRKHGVKKIKTIVFDGSSHDSHQHWTFMNLIDKLFTEYMVPRMCYMAGVPKQIGELITEASTKLSFDVYAEIDGNTIYRARVVGTTYSGHPTKTTLYNSIRVAAYIGFVFDKAGYEGVLRMANDDVVAFVSGDDAIIFCCEEAC